jgi:hypothetical protein
MKKIIAAAAILAALAAATRFGYDAGKTAGINHAIEDSEIFTVECYDPDDPYRNTRPDGLDQTIYIVLDGEYYEHGMWQG